MGNRFLPSLRMKIDRIYQDSINIEDYCL